MEYYLVQFLNKTFFSNSNIIRTKTSNIYGKVGIPILEFYSGSTNSVHVAIVNRKIFHR